jgi:hypothetical protein
MSCHGAAITSPGAGALTDSSLREEGAMSPQAMSVGSRAWAPALQRTATRCAASGERRPVVDQELSCPGRGAARSDAAQSRDPGSGNIGREVMFAEHDRVRMRIATRHPDVESQPAGHARLGPWPSRDRARPFVRYESIRRGTLRILRRYCSDRTEPCATFPKV